ncbi:MAG: replicative DNA helicase [Chryseolinea sp.]
MKPVPQAADIEVAVLGAALLERQAQIVVLEKLIEDDFFKEEHRDIFNALRTLANDGNPIDMRSVRSQLSKDGKKLELVGGAVYLAELTTKVSNSANVAYHCHLLIEQRIKRAMILVAHEIYQRAYEDTEDSFKLLDYLKSAPMKIAESLHSATETPIKVAIDKLVTVISNHKNTGSNMTGVPSGYESLDRVTHGWQPGNLIIIAGRPSMGKTTVVVNCARNAAVIFQKPVGIFSLEMSTDELTGKLVSIETEIPLTVISNKNFTDLDWTRFAHKSAPLYNAPILIDDTPALSILDLRVRCRRMKEVHGVELIIIDYLQLMRGEYVSKGGSNREQEISSISRTLKAIAKELNVPVIALSQLSRDVEKRPLPKIPQLADLRESGSIEQDADMVMFVWRPEYYKITGDERGTFAPGITKLIIAKHRNGELAEPAVQFQPKVQRFINADSPYIHDVKIIPQAELFDRSPNPDNRIEPQHNPDETPF